MKKNMTHEDVIAWMKKIQNGRSLAIFGKEIGVSAGFLSDVYCGKRGLGNKILTFLHLVQNAPTYRLNEEVKE